MPILLTFLLYVFSIIPYEGYISSLPDTVTSFPYYNSERLFAHVEKAGSVFSELSVGDMITVTYSDHSHKYIVYEIKKYIDLYPQFPDMDAGEISYADMDGNGLTAYDVVNQVYTTDGLLVLQTCLADRPGRLFVIARPWITLREMRKR
jgi:hypothetical protein